MPELRHRGPGRLGERPGWRAASTVIALALLLVLGAVGASYAALTGDSQPKQTASTPAAAAARGGAGGAPGGDHAAAGRHPAAGDGDGRPRPPSPSTLPKVKTPTAGATHGLADHADADDLDARTTPTPDAGTGTSAGTTGTGDRRPARAPDTGTGTTTTPADTGPKPIELNGDAGTIYDPFKRAKASGETTRALDGDPTTSWYVDPTIPTQIAVGYVVDLGKLQGVRQINLQTPTPGFRVEIYATDETTPPPDILDTRWSHIKDVSNVGAKDRRQAEDRARRGHQQVPQRAAVVHRSRPPTDRACASPSSSCSAERPRPPSRTRTPRGVPMSEAVMKTSEGEITFELFDEDAPKTVSNFKELAGQGFYDGLIFHRIIPDFMIQGGCPEGTGTGGPGYQFEDEFNDHKVVRGALAMANAGPNTNGSQFFIVTADECPWLDGKHTVFGQVTGGQDVVERIGSTQTDGRDRPVEPIGIETVSFAG